MSMSLINIGQSGATAARSALEVTAQNIANSQTEGYVRRRLGQTELAGAGAVGEFSGATFNGVRTGGIYRPDVPLLNAEARRSAGSLSQADAELSALSSAETTLEQSGLYGALVEFEASFAQLQSDPLNPSLRANALAEGESLANTFQLASSGLKQGGDFVRLDAQNSVNEVNRLAGELASVNVAFTRSEAGTASHAVLLDQRDKLLGDLSEQVGVTADISPSGVANVRLGDASGPMLVNGTSAAALSSTTNGDGTLSFDLDGSAVTLSSGKLAGQASALTAQAGLLSDLDAVAASTIGALNTAQSSGSAADGSAGQPFFSGSGAGDITVSLTDGSGIATAPSGAPAGSLDTSNLGALRNALANGGPASQADSMLFELSSTVRSRSVTRDALATIAQSAQSSLAGATGVDLDQEAANLIRFQQSFQASGRIIQVANDIFDTILGIR